MNGAWGSEGWNLKGCLPLAAAAIQNVEPGDRFRSNCDVHRPIGK
jgi:hypothetical protein